MKVLSRWLSRFWADMNYRYCMVQAQLATERHEIINAVAWSQQAADWQDEWRGLA